MASNRNRRIFPRQTFRTHGTLKASGQSWPVHIIDLSFKGALVALIESHPLQDGVDIELIIDMGEAEPIRMRGFLSHQKQHFLGLECQASSIDHKSRLHLLLEQLKQANR